MGKLKVGDLVLVTGPSHYEKATVISVEKHVATLDNQMKITHDYSNMSRTSMVAEPWDEEKYNILHAKHLIPKYTSSINRNWSRLDDKSIVALANKLEHTLNKFNLKMF